MHIDELSCREVAGSKLSADRQQGIRGDAEFCQLALIVHTSCCKVTPLPAQQGMAWSGFVLWMCVLWCMHIARAETGEVWLQLDMSASYCRRVSSFQHAASGAYVPRSCLSRLAPQPSCRAENPSFSCPLTCTTCTTVT